MTALTIGAFLIGASFIALVASAAVRVWHERP